MGRTWTAKVLETSSAFTASRALADLGNQLGDDRLSKLSRTSEAASALAALAGRTELMQLLKWTTAVPGLASFVQSGAYQQAIEEAMRQNVPNIPGISLDQVASPDTRALLADVKQVMAANPEAAEAASAVNVNLLNLLKGDAFGRLRQTPEFSRIVSGLDPARTTE